MGTEDKVEVGIQYISTRRDLPVFRGENGERVEEWIERIESLLDATHYPQAERSAFLIEHIDGVARREVKAERVSEKSGWDKIVGLLLDCYSRRLTTWGACYAIKQAPQHSLNELSLELRESYVLLVPDKGKRDDSILKERLCDTLRDVGVRVEAERIKREAGNITFGEFMKRVRAYKGSSSELRASVRMVKGEEGSYEGKWREAYENEAGKVKRLEVKIEELTDQFYKFRTSHREMTISTQPVQRKSQSVMRCMRCNGYGHWDMECREIRCRMCNAFGHSERECSGNGRP